MDSFLNSFGFSFDMDYKTRKYIPPMIGESGKHAQSEVIPYDFMLKFEESVPSLSYEGQLHLKGRAGYLSFYIVKNAANSLQIDLFRHNGGSAKKVALDPNIDLARTILNIVSKNMGMVEGKVGQFEKEIKVEIPEKAAQSLDNLLKPALMQ